MQLPKILKSLNATLIRIFKDKQDVYECPVCHKTFDTRTGYKMCLGKHQKVFHCVLCKLTFDSYVLRHAHYDSIEHRTLKAQKELAEQKCK